MNIEHSIFSFLLISDETNVWTLCFYHVFVSKCTSFTVWFWIIWSCCLLPQNYFFPLFTHESSLFSAFGIRLDQNQIVYHFNSRFSYSDRTSESGMHSFYQQTRSHLLPTSLNYLSYSSFNKYFLVSFAFTKQSTYTFNQTFNYRNKHCPLNSICVIWIWLVVWLCFFSHLFETFAGINRKLLHT